MPDYVMDVKGEDYLERFVDPGPAFDPLVGPDDAFFRAVIEESAEVVLAFGHDGTISYANDATRLALGYAPEDLIGTNALALVAPDDLENAAQTIHHAAEVVGWRPPRPFRLVHADGRLVTFEVAGLSLYDDARVRAIVIVARWADVATRVDRVIGLLAAQRPVPEVLAELVHLLHRPGWKLAVALQYDDGEGQIAAVSSGASHAMSGLPSLATGPWATARASGEPGVDIGMTTVPVAIRAEAEAAGFVSCWALPVRDPNGQAACLVVWNAEAISPELGQDLVLGKLRSLVELALAGRAHAAALDRAANCDPLTGLWNRRYLDAAAARATGRAGGGGRTALVVCDLDGFKLVNDELGHPAGDLVIKTVADRLRASVRDGDIVARLGGDEFAILCPEMAEVSDVERLAARILDVVGAPIDHPSGPIRVGVSVGIAVTAIGGEWDLDHLVRHADAQLLQAKASGKATSCLVVLPA